MNFENEQMLQQAISTFLKQYSSFKELNRSVEVWVDNEGIPRIFENTKNRFTLSLEGQIDYESKEALENTISEVLTAFPEFNLSFKAIRVFTNYKGDPIVFNDDGTEYVEPEPEIEPTETV